MSNADWMGKPCPGGTTIGQALATIQQNGNSSSHLVGQMKTDVMNAATACMSHAVSGAHLTESQHQQKVGQALMKSTTGSPADWGVVKSALEHAGDM